jgi:hypothetical protein
VTNSRRTARTIHPDRGTGTAVGRRGTMMFCVESGRRGPLGEEVLLSGDRIRESRAGDKP